VTSGRFDDADDEDDEPLEPWQPYDASDDPPVADTPMYLSHHWPDQYDRCAVVGGMHVCRRCLVLYPVALVTGVLISLGSWWPDGINAWVLWLFPLPGVIEFVLDNLGVIDYDPKRQVRVTAAGAVAAGVGYSMYIQDTFDSTVWAVVAVYTTVCVIAVIVGKTRGSTAS
jgi:hypothetical protein